MLSQIYYLLRSKTDGSYLLAYPKTDAPEARSGYLLMFREHFDALSYLNTHGSDLAARFAVESVLSTQLVSLLKRWGFAGFGIVQDPLLPKIEFLSHI